LAQWQNTRLPTQGLRVRSPSLQQKLPKGDVYWFFPGKMLPCISALHRARLRTWFVMRGGRSSILHYGPLIVTNYLYVPTPNGQARVRRQTKLIPPVKLKPLLFLYCTIQPSFQSISHFLLRCSR